MKKIIWLLIGFILTIGCTKKATPKNEDFLIGAGNFVLTAPADFKLVYGIGISNRYVGFLTNGEFELTFEYGKYANPGPPTYYEYVDNYLITTHQDLFKEACGLTDSSFLEMTRDLTILDVTRNSKFLRKSKNEISTTVKVGKGNCTVQLTSEGIDLAETYRKYHIEEQITDNIRTKLYYPKKDKTNAGIYIENLKEKKENRFSYNKLIMSTNKFNKSNSKEILRIFRSIKLKMD